MEGLKNIRQKALVYGLLFALAILGYYTLGLRSEISKFQDEREKIYKEQKQKKQAAVDSLKAEMETQADALNNQLQALAEQSEKLARKIRYYEKRPDLDFTFIAASDIIARSKYRPGPRNGNVGQEKND